MCLFWTNKLDVQELECFKVFYYSNGEFYSVFKVAYDHIPKNVNQKYPAAGPSLDAYYPTGVFHAIKSAERGNTFLVECVISEVIGQAKATGYSTPKSVELINFDNGPLWEVRLKRQMSLVLARITLYGAIFEGTMEWLGTLNSSELESVAGTYMTIHEVVREIKYSDFPYFIPKGA